MLDAALAADAAALGKDVVGLETGIEQMEAMASLPMDFHVQGLVDTLKLGARSERFGRDDDLDLSAGAHQPVLAAL